MQKAHSFFLPFIRKEKAGEDTFSFYFDRSTDSVDFIPGQYMRLTLLHENADEGGTSRYFTIASSPKQKDVLMFTIKIFQSTFKEALMRLRPGQEVQMFGPMGWFLLPEHESQEKVFLAGGIGITPFHSLLHTVADEELSQPMTLFASFRKKEDALFYEVLRALEKKNKQIRVIYTLTQEDEEVEWAGERGRVSRALLEKQISDLQKPVYYLVGAPAMVKETKKMLLAFGISEEKIQVEDFTGY